MDPETAKAIQKLAGESGKTFQSVTPEEDPSAKAKNINQTLGQMNILSQAPYFNPDRVLDYGRRDAGSEVELYDPETRMAVARIAREPKEDKKPIFWQSNSYDPNLDYDSVNKGTHISLIDPTTQKEVARMVNIAGGSGEPDETSSTPTNSETETLQASVLIRKVDSYKRKLKLATEQGNAAEINRLNTENEPLLNEHNKRLQVLADDGYIDPIEELIELKVKSQQGDDTLKERRDFLERTIRESFDDHATDPLFKNLLENYYTTELAAELSKVSVTPAPPTTNPAENPPTPAPIESKPDQGETFAEIQSRIEPILRIRNQTGLLTPEQQNMLAQLQEKQSQIVQKYEADPESRALLDIAKSAISLYVDDEVSYLLTTGGQPIIDPEHINERDNVIGLYLIKYPELNGYLKYLYNTELRQKTESKQSEIDSKRTEIEEQKRIEEQVKESSQKEAFEKVTFIYDSFLEGDNPVLYIESQIEDFESSGDSETLTKISARIKQLKAEESNERIKNKFNIELLENLRIYIAARMHLHTAQRELQPEAIGLKDEQLKLWGENMTNLLFARGQFYLKSLIKGIEDKRTGEFIQPLELLNEAEVALWSDTYSEAGAVSKDDPRIVTKTYNYFQFPLFSDDKPEKLTEYFVMKTLMIRQIKNQLKIQSSTNGSPLSEDELRKRVREIVSKGLADPTYLSAFKEYFNTNNDPDLRLAKPKDKTDLSSEAQALMQKAEASFKVMERLFRVTHVGSVLRGPLLNLETVIREKPGLSESEKSDLIGNFAKRRAIFSLRYPKVELLTDSDIEEKLRGVNDPKIKERFKERIRTNFKVKINDKEVEAHLIDGETDTFFDDLTRYEQEAKAFDFSKGRTPTFIARLFFEPVERQQLGYGIPSLRNIPLRRQDFFSMVADESKMPLGETITTFDEAVDKLRSVENQNSINSWVSTIQDAAKAFDFTGASPRVSVINSVFPEDSMPEIAVAMKTYRTTMSSGSGGDKDKAGSELLGKVTGQVNKLIDNALETYNFGTGNDKTLNLMWLEAILNKFLRGPEARTLFKRFNDRGEDILADEKVKNDFIWAFRYAFYTNTKISSKVPVIDAYRETMKRHLLSAKPRHIKLYRDEARTKVLEESSKEVKSGLGDIGKGISGWFSTK
jgi:hypothetical protein